MDSNSIAMLVAIIISGGGIIIASALIIGLAEYLDHRRNRKQAP